MVEETQKTNLQQSISQYTAVNYRQCIICSTRGMNFQTSLYYQQFIQNGDVNSTKQKCSPPFTISITNSLLGSKINRTKTTFSSVHKMQNHQKTHNKRAQHQIHSNKQIIIYHSRVGK